MGANGQACPLAPMGRSYGTCVRQERAVLANTPRRIRA